MTEAVLSISIVLSGIFLLLFIITLIFYKHTEKKSREKIEDLSKKLDSSEDKKSELSIANRELSEENIYLKGSVETLETTVEKYDKLVQSSSYLIELASIHKEDFLPQLLENTMEFLPEADFGSVSIINGEK